MPHLWMQDPDRQWSVLPLEGDRIRLDRNLATLREAGSMRDGAARLLRSAGPEDRWILLTESRDDVSVNGLPLPLGIRVLKDRDAIRLGGIGTVFFSTETLARVVRFVAGSQATGCARCGIPIEDGHDAVRCPACGLWHHEGADHEGIRRSCWSYAGTCAFCPQPTGLDGVFRWSPENA